jgi:hypothetical protein
MNYVEWLRVRNCLKWLAIVLGAMLVIGLIIRITVAVQMGNDESFVKHTMTEPGTKISHSVVGGINRTTILNPREHVTITIDDQPDGGRVIRVVEPSGSHREHADHVTIGSFSATHSQNGTTETTIIDTDAPVPFAYYLAMAGLVGLIVATIFGATFARENDGHLEIALLKPVSRVRYAFGVIGADVACIILAEAMTIVALAIGQAMFEVPHFDFSGANATFVLVALLHPFAWYALLNAATASLKRGAGAIVGFSWPVALAIVIFSHVNLGNSVTGETFHAIFWTLSRVIPASYASVEFGHDDSVSTGLAAGPWADSAQYAMLAALALVYGALAVVQWRRVEA